MPRKMKFEDIWDHVVALVDQISSEVDEVERGNLSAGRRVRRGLGILKVWSREAWDAAREEGREKRSDRRKMRSAEISPGRARSLQNLRKGSIKKTVIREV